MECCYVFDCLHPELRCGEQTGAKQPNLNGTLGNTAMRRPDRCSAGDSLHRINGRAECCALLRSQENNIGS